MEKRLAFFFHVVAIPQRVDRTRRSLENSAENSRTTCTRRYVVAAASLRECSDIIGKRLGRCTVMQNGAEVKEPIRDGKEEK